MFSVGLPSFVFFFFIGIPEPGLNKRLVLSLSLHPGSLLTLATLHLPSMLSWQLGSRFHVLQRVQNKTTLEAGSISWKDLL